MSSLPASTGNAVILASSNQLQICFGSAVTATSLAVPLSMLLLPGFYVNGAVIKPLLMSYKSVFDPTGTASTSLSLNLIAKPV